MDSNEQSCPKEETKKNSDDHIHNIFQKNLE